MQIYDTIVLLVILIAAFFGWRKGLATQIASIVSLVASYFVAVNFRGVLAAQIDAEPLFANAAAMLILFLGTSIVIWLIFRQVRSSIEAMKLGEFDHQMGAIFGAFKGFIIASLVTLFAVSLFGKNFAVGTVISSRSGHIITSFLNRAHSIMPAELHDYVGPYLHDHLENLNEHMANGQPAGYPAQQPYNGQTGYPQPGSYPQQQPNYPPSTAQRPTYQPQQPPAAYPPTYNQNPNSYPRSAPNYGSQTQPYNPPATPTYQPPGNWATPASPAAQPRY